jgi:hypothetical protein
VVGKVIRREVRRRGFFGWVFLILFLGFNAVMALVFVYLVALSPAITDAGSEAASAGYALGAGLAVGMVLVVWALGALITGLLALLTRGSKTIVEDVGL